MKVELFDFYLPEACIALRPLVDREAAKLLHVDAQGGLTDYNIGNLKHLLRAGDVLVFNDTKVLPACLLAQRVRGDAIANININLHMRVDADVWCAFARPLKRLKLGETLIFSPELQAEILQIQTSGEILLRFNKAGSALNATIFSLGQMPLPPYIARRRSLDEQDKLDYQTVFAKHEGAVAAPTAGLHFTSSFLLELKKAGIEQHYLTLHVGAGTFLPVKVNDTEDHKMHSEIGCINSQTVEQLNLAKKQGRRIIAVGTTALRLLESASDSNSELHEWSGPTDIFITPGYNFRFVDCLITNFHLPKSTLFMLVCAFSGLEQMKNAYSHAIANAYRFYSYGDASFLELTHG
ncbi:tRNA preQ1(34) S-adenosylmethionine ribosyltransferase-isomerase QueA [Bartonella sp. TP]|uniref:tRNA preQ1(34) S-adenosylmethionine ribosyltransferase-isomerase QueA n=1 Tax=Bartonella sp. TP TaxID=3057550 RepID=UPI0025B171A9|nr:tRNA preQ1(34) S-adenosylmethionine ribosyltransferase-isomerase QueA [Bartonella sp. TP]MDN5248858.1 tRNA preQ1(34) S-adenosylmethionine ribosyltransferase-isomerase QueA [Alphaproteobacteria bacterium]WJW79845.1 tRNA preQ1(34) S-adenosylmethionine ribosyltransferase-isomerase QueA [Bartonella sp. TP]